MAPGVARTASGISISIARDPALVRTVRLIAAAVARRSGRDEEFAALGYMWECPSVVRVPDEAGRVHDVLIFCPQGMEPTGEGFENIFPACALIGRLHGTSFHTDGPIRELDRIQIGAGSRGPVTEKIQTAFFDIVNGRNAKYAHWLTKV